MSNNFLKLNDDKTELIFLGTAKNLSTLQSNKVQVGNSTIQSAQSVRNIGAIFDQNMKMDVQVTSTCKAAWYRLHQIGTIRQYLSLEDTKSIIHAYVTSKLDYNNSLLAGCPDNLVSRLQRVQNAAAKLICRARKYDHVTNLLKDLHWLPVSHRIIFKILTLTYKALNNEGPSYLSDLLVYQQSQRTLRSSCSKLLHVPKSRLKTYGDRAFRYVAPTLWNTLPLSLRESSSTVTFKKNLKTHLFSEVYK